MAIDTPQALPTEETIPGPVPMPQEDPRKINVDPVQTEAPVIFNVDPGQSSANISPETADKRAYKFKYGLDEILQKSKDEIFQSLQNGDEDTLRSTAASEIDLRRRQETERVIAQVAGNKGGVLTGDEVSGLKEIMANLNENTDPSTVLEQAYGKQFSAELSRTARDNPDSFFNDVKYKFPQEVSKMESGTSTLAAKQQIAQTLLENITDEVQGQGWVPYLYDQAKFMVPGYQDVQLRGNEKSVGVFDGLGLGENLEEQAKALYRLPVSEFKDRLTEIAGNLRKSNPTLAASFVKAIAGQSTTEAALNNITIGIDLLGTGVGKGAYNVGKQLVTGADKVALQDAKKAFSDIARAAAEPDVSKSGIKEAAGDLKEAAVVRATSNAMGDLQNVPQATKRAVESLSTTLRSDLADIKAGSTNVSKEIVNRIEESALNAERNLFDTAATISKVERLPDVMAMETAVRAITEDMADNYRGIKNSVLDVAPPVKEKIGNTWLVDMHLGNPDGTYFKHRTVAENFIKNNQLGDATIIEGENAGRKAKTYYVDRNIADKPSFGYEIKNGKAVFYSDDVAKIITEHSETPKKGYVPVDIEEGKLNIGSTSFNENLDKRAYRINGEIFDKDSAEASVAQFKDYYGKKKIQSIEEGYVTTDGRFVTNSDLPGMATAQRVSVEQQGLGYYVKITVPVAENSPVVRSVIGQTKDTQLPTSKISNFFTTIFGKYRTPEEVLSVAERQNRLTVTNSPSSYFNILKDNTKEIRELRSFKFSKGRDVFNEWTRMLDFAQDKIDPATGKPGYFFKSPDDMATNYLQVLGRMPEDQEVAAYFEFKRGMEIDRVFRNISEHRNQQRVGALTNKVTMLDAEGKSIDSPEFSGITKRKLPGGDGNVVIFGDKLGEEKYINLTRVRNTQAGNQLDEAIRRGELRMVEIYNPELRPLSGYGSVGEDRIQYVISKTMGQRELDWNQIARRGGGHVEYDYDHYIKQAKIARDGEGLGQRYWYEGDTTLMPVSNRVIGGDVAKHLNEVRKLLLDKNEAGAREYSNTNLHIDWDKVSGWFKGGPDADGKMKAAQLSLDQEIRLVPKGKSIMQMDNSLATKYSNFKDGTKQNSLARQMQVQFSGERDAYDLMTINDVGTKGKPLYELAPANKVDPITSMNRGLSRIIKSNFMDDYKTMSVEHWLKNAEKWLDASPSEIRSSPFYYYNEAKFKAGTPPDIKAQLEASRYHTDQMVGMPSDSDAILHQMAQDTADFVYKKLGPNSPSVTPSWLLPKLKDPFAFIRSIVFHEKLGLGNIPQFIVQAGNYSNILGIAGYKMAAPGTLGAQLHFWSTVNSNPNIIKYLDDMAVKAKFPGANNWKPGEFTEALTELKKTGFGNPGGEVAQLDDVMGAKVIENGFDKFLDWGMYPFKKGEQNARYGAWYTAFKEFRETNPFGRITDDNRAAILQRADLLNVNMSRASSSAINKGIWSVPTQFYAYQIRLLELFWGTRLTTAEKGRMFATNAVLYGAPMGVGITGLPIVDHLRTKAMEDGYVVGDNYFKSMFYEGLPSAIGAVISGGGDPSKGTYLDFGQRFGTKGADFIGGATDKNKSLVETMGGAAYSVVKNTIGASDGLMAAMTSMYRRDGESFPMTVDDFTDPLKQISSVNSWFRVLAAAQTGRWVSTNEAYLTDATPLQASIAALTGLKPQEVDDIQLLNNSLKHQTEYEKEVEKQFQQEFRRGVLATKDGNYEQGKKFFTRAQVFLELGGYREDRIGSLMNKAIDDNKSVLEKLQMDFYIRKAPDAQKDKRSEAMKNIQQIKDKKEQ